MGYDWSGLDVDQALKLARFDTERADSEFMNNKVASMVWAIERLISVCSAQEIRIKQLEALIEEDGR